ncbi:MAG: hypothetical protein LAQ30_27040 [Acidobacteriia bacterium]|nr:hypothetical protein [Terriglobia bacterium]
MRTRPCRLHYGPIAELVAEPVRWSSTGRIWRGAMMEGCSTGVYGARGGDDGAQLELGVE